MARAAASGSATRRACLNTRSPPVATSALLLAQRGVGARQPAVVRRGGSRPLRDRPSGDGYTTFRAGLPWIAPGSRPHPVYVRGPPPDRLAGRGLVGTGPTVVRPR